MTPTAMQLMILASIPMLALGTITVPTFDLKVDIRQPDYIIVSWEVNDTSNAIDAYEVQVTDDSNGYTITYRGEPYVNQEKNEAKVTVHEPNKSYNICIIAVLTEEARANLSSTHSVQECIGASTIKAIQVSSIVALVLLVGFFVLCFVVGYIVWKCAVRKHQSKHQYEKSDVNGNGDIVPLTHIED